MPPASTGSPRSRCAASTDRGADSGLPLRTDEPFVLIDDARRGDAAAARLFTCPTDIVRCDRAQDVPALLAALEAARRDGLWCAGYLTYEAGYGLERRLAPLAAAKSRIDGLPLAWFGLFDRVREIPAAAVPALLGDPAGAFIGPVSPQIAECDYVAAVDATLEHIRAGDIYQANVTFAAKVAIVGDPIAAYAALRMRARAGHGAVVHTGADWLLSLSPELFFALDGDRVTARPMKGTAPRRADAGRDARARAALAADPKQRAENLMIVDLMRNDLARVSCAGSVAVPRLFAVETYPSVHQMVSDVTARLLIGKGATDVLRAAFPCGSITGAPKIRAMEIIADREPAPRGAYTGSIGFIAPDGDAAFNVAIRTLALSGAGLPGAAKRATLGLGAGIVADSVPADEWRECLVKGKFVGEGRPAFDLIETMGFDPVEGIGRIEAHLARMSASAAVFGFAFDRHRARNELQAATFRLARVAKVRLMLASSGAMAVEVRDAVGPPAAPVAVALATHGKSSEDFRLCHKTSDRAFYDDARIAAGTWEAVFVDRRGFVTEGSFTNIFVDRSGTLLTPPVAHGLLPGVLRGDLIGRGRAVESPLRVADLADGFFLGNSVRGLIPARLAVDDVAHADAAAMPVAGAFAAG